MHVAHMYTMRKKLSLLGTFNGKLVNSMEFQDFMFHSNDSLKTHKHPIITFYSFIDMARLGLVFCCTNTPVQRKWNQSCNHFNDSSTMVCFCLYSAGLKQF